MVNRSQLRVNIPTISLISVLLIGFLVRIRQYAIGASLWIDEAALALNIINRSFFDLIHPLDHQQGAPVGFLWLIKLAITAGNEGEFWLRLVPLLAGLLTLALFPLVARHYLSRNATLLALLILTLSYRLIYYSVEAKQYSVDVLVTVCGLALFLMLRNKPLTLGRSAVAIVAGSLMLWISHPAVFILGMVGLHMLISAWRSGDRYRLMRVLLIGLAWLASFAILMFLTLRDLAQNEYLLTFWARGFPPSITTGIPWLRWHLRKIELLITYGLGTPAVGLASLAILSGIITYYRKDKNLLFSLVTPLGLVLLASWIKRYPLESRMILFTAPIMAILVAQGVEDLIRALRPRSLLVACALPIILLINPAIDTLTLLRRPEYKEELRPIVAEVRGNWQDGDHIYLYHEADYAFEYYRSRYGFSETDFTSGTESRADWLVYFKELDELAESDRRIWLIFTHVHDMSGANEEMLFINYLNNKGISYTDKLSEPDATAYLYDFRRSDGGD